MRRLKSLTVATAALLALAACGDDEEAAPPTTRATTTTSTTQPTTTSTTQPPGTDPEAVRPYLEALFVEYDEVVNAILADPRVAADPNHELVQRYLALFTPGSTFAAGTVEFWADEAEQGHFYRPGTLDQIGRAEIVGVRPGTADQINFTACSFESYVVVDEAGDVIESVGGPSPGEGVALRVDGRWLLRDLTFVQTTDICPERLSQ